MKQKSYYKVCYKTETAQLSAFVESESILDAYRKVENMYNIPIKVMSICSVTLSEIIDFALNNKFHE